MRVGETLAGRYELRAALGGGRGALFSAHDRRTERSVVIKMFDPARVTAADLQRYAGRLAAAERVEHPAVVLPRVQVATAEAPPFVVSELLAGEDLAGLCERAGPLPWERALAVARDCADGLAALAAATGAAHGAVHPGNVWVDRAGRGQILDFGIAELGAPQLRARADGNFAEFRAPEQLEGSAADFKSDVFSLGALLYTMVTGVAPFSGANAAAVNIKVLMHGAAPVTSLAPQLPAAVAAVIGRALARKAKDRYADAAALGRELAGLLPAAVVPAVVAMPVPVIAAAPEPVVKAGGQEGRLVWEPLPVKSVEGPEESLREAVVPETALREQSEDSLSGGDVLPETTVRERRIVLERAAPESTVELPATRTRAATGERAVPETRTRAATGERAVATRTRAATGERAVPETRTRAATGERAVPVTRTRAATGERAVPVTRTRAATGERAVATRTRAATGERAAVQKESTLILADERSTAREESTLMLPDEPALSGSQGRVEATEMLQADELPTRTRMPQVPVVEDPLRLSGSLQARVVRGPAADDPAVSQPGRSMVRRQRVKTLLVVNVVLGGALLCGAAWLLFGR